MLSKHENEGPVKMHRLKRRKCKQNSREGLSAVQAVGRRLAGAKEGASQTSCAQRLFREGVSV